MPEDILLVKQLRKYFPAGKKGQCVRAVDGVDFSIRRAEILGIVGESGSGKSTVAYTVVGMFAPTSGEILFKGCDVSCSASRRPVSIRKNLQIVFQDPGTSLNPQQSVRQILELPLRVHRMASPADMSQRIAELLEMVELPEHYMRKHPRALGGGERQMVAIARAMATRPELMILDEPTSALDVSVQAKIVNTLTKLQRDAGMSYLFITHDLSLMRNLAHRVAIMYLGKIVEMAPAAEFFQRPLHPYTQMLLSSIPVVSKEEESLKPEKVVSRGEIPSPVDVPRGCRFHPRCALAVPACSQEEPRSVQVGPDHLVSCHLHDGPN